VPAIVALIFLAIAVGACGDDQAEPEAVVGDPGVVHVHGLGRNSADGSLMVATHTGLFRAGEEGGRPERVANRFQDTMGFTVIGPDHFLGSGHPASVREDPPFLGLIESRDAGNTWRPISLRGEMDFHVLEAHGDTVYGFGSDFESREPRFMVSENGGRSWERRTPPEGLTGLAIDPSDPDQIVGLGEQRGYFSRDGGGTWRPIDLPGGLIAWTPEIGLVAADFDGVIRTSGDPMGEWNEAGRLNGTPAALEGVDDELLAATHDARVLSSRDRGSSWQEILRP
jgi:hypothetical protein